MCRRPGRHDRFDDRQEERDPRNPSQGSGTPLTEEQRQRLKAQLERFSHTCFQVPPYDVYVQLAARLNEVAPGPAPKKSMFLTTGAEAVENAVKISRQHTGRSGVIAFSGAFHGRTMLCLALTGKVIPYKAGFGPFPAAVFHVPFPIDYHVFTLENSLAALVTRFHSAVQPSRIAAWIA